MSGCAAPGPGGGIGHKGKGEDIGDNGRLSLFINLQEADSPVISMQITGIDLLDQSGIWQTFAADAQNVNSGTIKNGQQFLARIVLRPDTYSRLRLQMGEVTMLSNKVMQPLVVSQEQQVELELRDRLQIETGDSRSLFLTWDVKGSVREDLFHPVLLVAPRLKKLIADVGYVACPDINTVYMFSTEKNRVIDSIGIENGPSYLFRNSLFDNEKVYALTRTALAGFSTAANEVVEQNNLSMANNPAHMSFSPDGQWAYILDQQRGSVLQMDMNSGAVVNQARLNYAPNYIIYLERYDQLAVSVGITQNILLLDPQSLETRGTISTGGNPSGLLNWNDRSLYIAESGSNSVMIYDLQSNSMVKRITAGFQPRRLARSDTYIYAANYASRTVSVIHPGIPGVSRTIQFPGQPLEMVYADKNKWLYIGNEQQMSLEVIETTINEIVGHIELGAVPAGIVILDK